MLLERDDALTQLHGALARARDGRGGVALVGAEAGAGKTSLIREFLRQAAGRPAVLAGACDPLAAPRPLGPLIDAAAGVDAGLAARLAAGMTRAEAFAAATELLAGAGNDGRATVFVVEDVHWADDATLDLITHLGRRIATLPALLVLSYRDDEVDARHPLRARLGDLAGAIAERVRLAPLSPAAVATLAAGSGLDATELHRASAGNAFYVTEVIGAGGNGVPESIRDAVLARASRLPVDARAVLDAAAIVPGRVERWLLATLIDGDATAGLDVCLDRGLLVEQPGDALGFRHELARLAIDGALTSQRRRELHRRALTTLRDRGGTSDARLAHHAAAADDGAAVLAHAPTAAATASAAGGHREAVALLELALRHEHLLDRATLAELLGTYGRELGAVARPDEAVAAFDRASRLCIDLGDPEAAAEQTLRASRALVTLGRQPEAERLLAEAEALLEGRPPSRARALLLDHQAAYHMLARRLDDCEALAPAAIALAEEVGDDGVLAETLIQTGIALAVGRDLDGGVARVRRGIELGHAVGNDALVSLGLSQIGSGCGEIRQYSVAVPALEEGIAFCDARELIGTMHYMQAWLARCQLELGRWDEAARTAGDLVRSPRCAGISRFVGSVTLAWVRARRGDPDVGPLVDDALAHARTSQHLQRLWPVAACRAEIAWMAGRLDDELGLVEDAAALAAELDWTPAIEELAHWRHIAGGQPHRDAAGARTPFGLSATGRHDLAADRWREVGCPYEEAMARFHTGDPDQLRRALEAFDRLGAAPMRARTAAVLRELGERIPRGPTEPTRHNPHGLTERELDVLAELATGRTNKEIAAALGISAKTVGHHVSSVLTKLDARTRAEAAVAAARLGLPDPRVGRTDPGDRTAGARHRLPAKSDRFT